MANYSISKSGDHIIHSRYSKSGVLRLNSIFPDDKDLTNKILKKRKTFKGRLSTKYKVKNNSLLVRRIFTTFLFKVLDRVAEGELFVLPGTTMASIALKPIAKKQTSKLLSAGQYSNVNMLFTEGYIPQFVFDFGPKVNRRDIPIYVPREVSNKAIDFLEDGRVKWQYFNKII